MPSARSAAGIRRVAVLAPMPSELRPLASRLSLRPSSRPGDRLWRASVGRVEVVAALAGVGMRAAGAAADRLLALSSPDHLLVVGIAGAVGDSVAIGDVVVPEQVLDLDSGARLRASPLAGRPARGTLASSDRLLESPDVARALAERGVVAIDMETAAIAAVCERRGCAWSAIRGISDRADDGSTDAAVLTLIDAQGRPRPAALIRFVLTRPGHLPQLLRLARGAGAAARAAAEAASAALRAL